MFFQVNRHGSFVGTVKCKVRRESKRERARRIFFLGEANEWRMTRKKADPFVRKCQEGQKRASNMTTKKRIDRGGEVDDPAESVDSRPHAVFLDGV